MTTKNAILLIVKQNNGIDYNSLLNKFSSSYSNINSARAALSRSLKDLISFGFSLPERMKQRGSCGKWILKKMMENYLPKEIIYRPKVGFGVPLREWMKNNNSWLLNEFFSSKSIKNRGLFDENFVRLLIKNNLENKIDASYTIFSMICIETWLRIFIDKKTSLF